MAVEALNTYRVSRWTGATWVGAVKLFNGVLPFSSWEYAILAPGASSLVWKSPVAHPDGFRPGLGFMVGSASVNPLDPGTYEVLVRPAGVGDAPALQVGQITITSN